MNYDQYNPIRSVDGQYLKCPSSYQWKLQDISASDAGRTEANIMDKKRLGQCVKLELLTRNTSTSVIWTLWQANGKPASFTLATALFRCITLG